MAGKGGYLTFSNFKAGLDTRRSELTSIPGALLRLIDGQINQGAEVEKRKAFVPSLKKCNGVYGALPFSGGIYVFGSRNLPASITISQLERISNVAIIVVSGVFGYAVGDWIRVSIPSGDGAVLSGDYQITSVHSIGSNLRYASIGPDIVSQAAPANSTATSFPAPMVYQRIQMPVGFSALTNAMTSLIASTLFNGKAFIVVTLNNAGTNYCFCFYDGVLVEDFRSGVVGIGTGFLPTNSDVMLAIEGMVNATGLYTATPNVAPDNTAVIAGKNGRSFSVLATDSNVTHEITNTQAGNPFGATNAAVAIGSFIIERGEVGAKITSITVDAVEVLGSTLSFTSSEAQLAGDVCVAINRYCQLIGLNYTAQASGTTVNISSAIAGTAANDQDIGVAVANSAGNGICIGFSSFTLNVTGTTPTATISSITVGGGANILSGAFTNTNMSSLADAVVADINNHNATYIAARTNVSSNLATIYLSKRVTTGSDAQLAVVVTYTSTHVTLIFNTTDVAVSAVVSPATANCTDPTRVTQNVAITTQGGVQPYTYAWVLSGANAGSFLALSPSSAITAFQFTGIIPRGFNGYYATCTATCTVTDSTTPSPSIITVTVQVSYNEKVVL